MSHIVSTSEKLIENTGVLKSREKNCSVINLWLDESRFRKKTQPTNEIQKLVKSNNSFGIFIGALRWYKGLDILLSASKKTKYKIFIVGTGPMKEKLENRIDKEKIKNVKILGFLEDSDLFYLIKNTTFTVLPSISPAEAFGQVLLESMYFKKPCITTSLGTATDHVNLHNETGFVVKPNNAEELTNAMNKLFENKEICEIFGTNGYKRYLSNFSEKSESHKYNKIYFDLLK